MAFAAAGKRNPNKLCQNPSHRHKVVIKIPSDLPLRRAAVARKLSLLYFSSCINVSSMKAKRNKGCSGGSWSSGVLAEVTIGQSNS